MNSSIETTEKREGRRDVKNQKKEPRRQDRHDKRGFFSEGPVTTDNIRKEVINREKKLQRAWPERYNYLTGQYFKQVLAEECRKARLPVDTFERKKSEDPVKKSPIPLKPSPSFPKTSSAMIGWRSSLPENDLEFSLKAQNFVNFNLKKWLSDKRFWLNEEVITETNTYFEGLEKTYYLEGIKKLESRWTKCIELKGDYVEK